MNKNDPRRELIKKLIKQKQKWEYSAVITHNLGMNKYLGDHGITIKIHGENNELEKSMDSDNVK